MSNPDESKLGGEITRRHFLGLGAAAVGGALTDGGWASGDDPSETPSSNALKSPVTRIDTADLVGLETPEVRIAFERTHGRLVSLYNHLTKDEYLKEPQQHGNPFRIYTDFIRSFELGDDPSEIARTALDPASCRLVAVEFGDDPNLPGLGLSYRDEAQHWQMHLGVKPSAGESSEWTLEVVNIGTAAGSIIVDFPHFDRGWLGQVRQKNLATVLEQAGHIARAMDHPGGVYGDGGHWSMQWHCIFDPDSGSALGLIIKDPDVRNKQLGEGCPSVRIITFPEHKLLPRECLSLPPVQLLLYRGDWRHTAREYRKWFALAFRPLEPPDWARRSDSYTGGWFGKRGGASMQGATEMDSFRDLVRVYRATPIDNQEFAFHDRGCQFQVSPPGVEPPRYVHTTGDNILREDLGGPDALREGVAAVHRLGFHFTFYVEGYIVHETSELARDGRAARWSVMHKNGTIIGNYTSQGFYHMCPGCVEWQDHLASACSRLIGETGADGLRLDSLGFYFLPCYNPAHKHPHPFVYNDGLRQLVDKVSRAVRAANPNAVITTEAPVDFLASYAHGALTSMCPRDIPPMRVALANYHPVLYGTVGAVWGSLSGYIGGTSGGMDINWRCARFPVDETVVWGEVEDDPVASEKRVICRLFKGSDHWALVGARVDSDEQYLLPRGLDGQPTLGLDAARNPVQVRVRGLGSQVESAIAVDVETLQAQPVAIEREGEDLLVSTESRWFVVILRKRGSRPLASFGEVPAVRVGEVLPIPLRIVSPHEGKGSLTATLSAPALGIHQEVRLPGMSELRIPKDTPPGRYMITLSGPSILGHKRFVEVRSG